MSQLYLNDAIQFQYPDDWKLDENRTSDGLTVSLQTPYSMFVFINCYDSAVDAQDAVDQALETMEDEYPDLDSNPIEEKIAEAAAVGYDVNFFSLDLTNTCWIRAFSAGDQTVLIFAQTNDLDLGRGEPAFRWICESLKFGTPNSN